MKSRGLYLLLALVSGLVLTGLACSAVSPAATDTVQPTQQPAPTEAAVVAPTDSSTVSNSGGSSATTTFTDKNNYYSIDVPGEWNHTTGTDTNTYWDRFTAPDKHAFIENIAYDDGTPWTGGSNGRGALYLLNHAYSSTGKEGDIRVSNDSIQKDGSERLTWTSKGGNYSGVSFFEVRNRTTFLMFTVWWDNDFESTYRDVLDSVVSSYR